jgi:cytochrome c5
VLRVLKSSRMGVVFKGLLLAVATGLGGSLAFAAVQDQIRERIQPAGEVCVMGTDCAAGLAAVAGAGGARDVATIYQNFCFACHGTGVNNAPVKDNAEHWNPRLEERGIDTLYANAINGFNNGLMPVKGLCMDCSDDELHAAVDYMLEGIQ